MAIGRNTLRGAAIALLTAIALASLWPEAIRSVPYDHQFRDHPNASMTSQFPLGTDNLGRDRLSRLLHGTRISLLAAPAAALLSTILAGLIGGLTGYAGGWFDRVGTVLIDLMLSLPWLFLLIIVRALLPLNVPALLSVGLTFGMIGLLGWGSAARVVRAGCRDLRRSDLAIHAAASGVRRTRILLRHVLPNVRPVLVAKFWASIPVYILAEANLGLLGLGVSDPLPSWGNMLRQLENGLNRDVAAFSPLLLLVAVVGCLHLARPREAC